MISQETVQQLQHAPVADRIQLIEILLQSLKHDIVHPGRQERSRTPFRVRTFNLGTNNSLDREEMYAEKGM